jgi:hypothetical protein
MSRQCPSCKETMGRLIVSRPRERGARWYQFVPTHFYCPKCRAQVRPTTKPIGYVLQGLMVVASFAWISLVMQATAQGLSPIAVTLAGLLLLVVMLGFACARWGFTYSS